MKGVFMPEKKQVLIVEDDDDKQDFYAACLGDLVQIIRAKTIQDGRRRFFETHPNVSVVVMDGCVPETLGAELNYESPNTLTFVEDIRRGSGVAIIAASNDPAFRGMLIKAGCDFQAEKKNVPAMVRLVVEG